LLREATGVGSRTAAPAKGSAPVGVGTNPIREDKKMISLTTFAAVAALIAAPASADEIRVRLDGKSAEQARIEVTQAVQKLCIRATSQETFRMAAIHRCIRETKAKVEPDLEAKLAARNASKTLATR
jgi:hypothetical protein